MNITNYQREVFMLMEISNMEIQIKYLPGRSKSLSKQINSGFDT